MKNNIFEPVLTLRQFFSQRDDEVFQFIFDFGIGQAIVDTGGHENELVAYVIADSFKSFREDALRLVQGIDCIGQLDLAACSRSLAIKYLEDFWCQQR